ncbi:MAG TPA: ABC transporter permease [Chloroflexota bacterium]|nr:ABC transporter permease [Chloroflexota bacterium]
MKLPPTLLVGGLLVGLVVLTALVSVVWTPVDPTHVEVGDRLKGPMPGYLLGTDQVGRDELSRLMAGATNTLIIGIVTVVIALGIGVPLGGVAALYRGRLEDATMRLSDVLLAFPAILLAILFAAVFQPSRLTAMAAIGIALVPVFARVVRGAGLQVMQQDYVTIVRTYGGTRVWIFVRHLLPNVSSVLIVQATVAFAVAILAEAALSYLGLGTPPPTPSWGRMLSESQTFLNQAPLLAVWPGVAIALAVLGFNLLGDGLRDLLDPKP